MNLFISRLREIGASFLNFRYLVAASSVTFLLAFGVAFLLVFQNAEMMREQINLDFNQQQLSLAKQAANQIEGTLGDLELELSRLKRFLETSPGPDPAARAMDESLMRYRAKGLLEVSVRDRQGEVVEALHAGSPPAQGPLPCAEPAGDHMVLGPLRAGETAEGRPLVTSVVCMEIGRGRFEGRLLSARLDVSDLVGAALAPVRSGRTGYAWAIDNTGMFLFHPDHAFIGKSAMEARKERQPYISYAQINAIMMARMRFGEEGVGEYVSGWHRGVEGKMAKLIGFAPVPASALPTGSIWSVAVVAPKEEVAGAVHRVTVRHIAAAVAILVGSLVFGLLVMVYQYRMRQNIARTTARFHEIERIYQQVVAQATDLIYVLDREMRIVLINQHAVDLLARLMQDRMGRKARGTEARSLPRDFFLGRSLTQVLDPGAAASIKEKMDQVLESGRGVSFEHSIEIQGRRLRLSTNFVAIRDESREVPLILGIARDVTEKHEMDQRIYHTEKLASIGTLAAGVAHEINNPLGIILGFTDLLKEKICPGSPECEDLGIIEQQATNAKKIVENLLGFARVVEGRDDAVDVNLALETVTKIVGNTLMTKKMHLFIDVPDDLPRVRGDSREFQQVIFNLVSNSIAAMEGTGGDLGLSARADDAWVHVSVSDTGPGVPEEIRSRIFDPFFTTKKVGEGTGLGLSLCYGVVTKYGGRIRFTSNTEESRSQKTGTVFTVSMPIERSGGMRRDGQGEPA
jgi:two-component system NtrC family sensor kinase